jgi:hypothetical protein
MLKNFYGVIDLNLFKSLLMQVLLECNPRVNHNHTLIYLNVPPCYNEDEIKYKAKHKIQMKTTHEA